MKPPPFDYAAPRSVDEAVELLGRAPEETSVLAGGQSLMPVLNMRLAQPSLLIDISRTSDLDYVRAKDGALCIGAAATQATHLRTRLPSLVRTYHHPVGSCRMGVDPDGGAVVDPRGRLHGADGLIVADASVMPTIPRANTNLPTLMLAERIAAWLRTPGGSR
jgi:choline dehydrogenase-like flavoprotein